MLALLRLLLVLVVASVPLACDEESPECTGVQGFGLVIEVTDAVSGETLCDASVHLEHDSYEDEIGADSTEPCRYLGATVPGRYTISVSREGYEPTERDVEVSEGDSCSGLETREISVPLTPVQ